MSRAQTLFSFRPIQTLAGLAAAVIAMAAPPQAEPAQLRISSDGLFRPTGLLEGELGSSRGVAWGDFDNDGFPDLVISNTNDQPLLLYRNLEGRGFERVIDQEIGSFTLFAEGLNWVDFDNDGWLDLFVATTLGPNLLFRNTGGEFSRVQGSALTDVEINTSMACWADFDNDGWLDVFLATRGNTPDRVFVNQAGNRFEEVETVFSRIANDARACAAADLNGDLLPDIYVGNFLASGHDRSPSKASNALYFGTADGRFARERRGFAVNSASLTYGLVAVDFDYDGDVDLFQTSIAMSDRNYLFENLGKGLLYPRSDLSMSQQPRGPSKGVTWGDFDLDGNLDLAIAEGTEGLDQTHLPYDVANLLFLGSADGFRRVVSGEFVSALEISAGIASADFDNDGDLDLAIANWGGEGEANRLYENLAEARWVAFELEGRRSNRMSVGARVTIHYLLAGELRSQTRFRNAQAGYASANANDLHFGLGEVERIERACAHWPSGAELCVEDLPVDQIVRLIEPE